MGLMADPMIALREFQRALDTGVQFDSQKLEDDYFHLSDVRSDEWKKYSYLKVINGEVQALAIFGLDGKIGGVDCYSLGYAVSESRRGDGLAVEAVCKGIDELKKKLRLTQLKCFYVEAIVDVENEHSIVVAEKLFPKSREAIIERYSERPAFQFKRLIAL